MRGKSICTMSQILVNGALPRYQPTNSPVYQEQGSQYIGCTPVCEFGVRGPRTAHLKQTNSLFDTHSSHLLKSTTAFLLHL